VISSGKSDTDAIQRKLEQLLDGSLMFWCDVDVQIYQ
jgi:hypothetical protein